DQTRSGPGFNRRDFLKGSGAAVAATALATQEAEAQKSLKPNVAAAKPQAIKLNVNGKTVEVTVEPRTTLLDVLRSQLDLTGCKHVEDQDYVLGADTVMVDGKATYAGKTLAIAVQGKKITTAESLRNGDKVDEVVSGFVKHDAMQCGFCTPGFVVATRAFLNSKPKATLDEIQKGLGGNICRCGTYQGITQCALEIAKGGQ
ncbi:MAG: 2Fe-2S iron-sulfur cluster-binding protein, partial [Planctomycetota bacterium]|nr:2Fe-2S iron-sulfur cluster-binding protein [Planctomycetota bacterium]